MSCIVKGSRKAAGLRHVRFHDGKPTIATLLIQQNANVKYIQQQFGHSSINITLDVYSHLFTADHRHQLHRLDDECIEVGSARMETAENAPQPELHEESAKSTISKPTEIKSKILYGGVTERPNVPVLKTGDGVTHPRVQISPPPPHFPR